jgi:hypothetical protein
MVAPVMSVISTLEFARDAGYSAIAGRARRFRSMETALVGAWGDIIMKKWPFFIVIGLVAVIGAYMAAGYWADDREVNRRPLEVIQNQLADLKTLLQAYKASHGAYPSNDEGLVALDSFETRFAVNLRRNQEGFGERYAWRQWWAPWWQAVMDDYRRQKGFLPHNAGEFSAWFPDIFRYNLSEADATTVPGEIAFSPQGRAFVLSPAGVMSPWLIPYVYENRTGANPQKFQDSPVDSDWRGRWSIRIDDGIYVYSFGGKVYAEHYDRAWWDFNLPRLFGGALLLGAFALWFFMLRKNGQRGLWVLLLAGLAGGAASLPIKATCYIMTPAFCDRDPQAIVQQRELLDKYHERGVIGDETYEKAVTALEKGT